MGTQTLVILQARSNSSRFPGKALLKLGGIESALLAALRGANTGQKIVLATSNQSSDDILSQRASRLGLQVFRGDLSDVRSRFVELSANLEADDVLVRLTGDCTFPDGSLVDLAVTALLESGSEIIRSMEDPFIPYGLSVEAFRVSTLRESLSDSSPAAQEHVTPPLIQRQASFVTFVPLDQDLSHLRCCLDTSDDYDLLQEVFHGIEDPVSVGWQELVDRLGEVSVPKDAT